MPPKQQTAMLLGFAPNILGRRQIVQMLLHDWMYLTYSTPLPSHPWSLWLAWCQQTASPYIPLLSTYQTLPLSVPKLWEPLLHQTVMCLTITKLQDLLVCIAKHLIHPRSVDRPCAEQHTSVAADYSDVQCLRLHVQCASGSTVLIQRGAPAGLLQYMECIVKLI